MKPHKEIQMIDQLLERRTPKYKNVNEMLAWQRGFLTGLLASLAHNDITVRLELIKRLEEK